MNMKSMAKVIMPLNMLRMTDEAKAVDDALVDEVGSGSAAVDVQDVLGGKDNRSVDAVANEDVRDATEEDLGINLHAKRKVTGRKFTSENTTKGNTAIDVEVTRVLCGISALDVYPRMPRVVYI